MKILLTNDDGIASPALARLAVWAKRLGDVTVIAPKVEQSGKSHAIDFFREIEIKAVPFLDGIRAYSVDSTPADCVRFAVLGLKERFDLVLSGPNRGFNLGLDIVYSGTVGAIFEAARLGMPAIAISTEPTTAEPVFSHLDELRRLFTEHKLLSHASLYNINIPLGDKGIRITRQGGYYFTDEFERREGDMYMQVGSLIDSSAEPLCYDTAAICNGYISVTPLSNERTHLSAFEALQGILAKGK